MKHDISALNLQGFVVSQVWAELCNYNMKSNISKVFGLCAEDPWPISYNSGMESEFLLPEDLLLPVSV